MATKYSWFNKLSTVIRFFGLNSKVYTKIDIADFYEPLNFYDKSFGSILLNDYKYFFAVGSEI